MIQDNRETDLHFGSTMDSAEGRQLALNEGMAAFANITYTSDSRGLLSLDQQRIRSDDTIKQALPAVSLGSSSTDLGGEVGTAVATAGDDLPIAAKDNETSWDFLGREGALLAQAEVPEKANTASDAATAVNIASNGKYGNNPFFNPSAGVVGLLTGVDVNPATIAGYLSSALSSLEPLNDVLSGRGIRTYEPMTGPDGKPVVCVMPQRFWQSDPKLTFNIDGQPAKVKIDLPDFSGHAVTFATDGRRVVALDPKNSDVWILKRNNWASLTREYTWEKLKKK